MSGTIVLNPATVDGYGNPISLERDESRGVNRVFGTTIVEGQPHVELYDASGNPVKIGTENGFYAIFVRDEEQLDVLKSILVQLKVMNKHLMSLSEFEVEDEDEMEDEEEG